MREFAAPAVTSGLLAALAAYVIGLLAVGRQPLWGPVLSVPAAVAVAAVWWPVLWAAGGLAAVLAVVSVARATGQALPSAEAGAGRGACGDAGRDGDGAERARDCARLCAVTLGLARQCTVH
jgi:hypothetical protein